MSLKYECCYCKCVFPSEESIDGYKQGYKIGFLCPECGKNIQGEMSLLKLKIDSKDKKWYVLFWAFILSMFFTKFSDKAIEILGYEINIFFISVLFTIVYLIILYLFKPSLLVIKPALTQPVSNA